MATYGSDDDELEDFLAPAVARVLGKKSFDKIEELIMALKKSVVSDVVDRNHIYICNAWATHLRSQGSERPPSPPLSHHPASCSPASDGRLELEGDDDDLSTFSDGDSSGHELNAPGDQASGSLTLYIYHIGKEGFSPFAAIENDQGISFIEQDDAKDLGLDPSDVNSYHELRWYSKKDKMTTTEFKVVRNKSLGRYNVSLGRGRAPKDKQTTGAGRRGAPSTRPRAGAPPQESATRGKVSPDAAAAGSHRIPGREERLHHAFGERFDQVLQAHLDAERDSVPRDSSPKSPTSRKVRRAKAYD